MSPHVSDAELDRFVSGQPIDTAFDAHVAECAACAARLQAEAAADMALYVAATTQRPRRATVRAWVPLALAASLAALVLGYRLTTAAAAVEPRFRAAQLASPDDVTLATAILPLDTPDPGALTP